MPGETAPRLIVTGPTASGKGGLSVELARRLDGEIVSIDSMKIYRGMEIGTAKPSAARREAIDYHLVDIADPTDEFSVGEFLPEVYRCIEEIESRGRRVILQGGTAFYLNALLNGLFEGPGADSRIRSEIEAEIEARGLGALHAELRERDPEAALKVHAHDRKRIIRALEVIRLTGRPMTEMWREEVRCLEPGSYRLLGIDWPREELYARIDRRVERMVAGGLFEEVRSLVARPGGLGPTAAKCIGYRQVLEGEAEGLSEEEITERIQRDTRRFAKQQLTWFRRFDIEWLRPGPAGELAERVITTA